VGQFALGAGSPPSLEAWRTSSRRGRQGGRKQMKTTKQLREMKHDELITEEKAAFDYWRKVVAFRDVAQALEEYE